MKYNMEQALGSHRAQQVYGQQMAMKQAERNRLRAMDPNASKSMTEKEKEEALNKPARLLERVGGFTAEGYRPGSLITDKEGKQTFAPRYRDFVSKMRA